LYGLKQATRAWYENMDEYLLEVGFKRSEYDDTLYVCLQGYKNMVMLVMYVDDLIITGNNDDHIS
jgi:hypothetical protein